MAFENVVKIDASAKVDVGEVLSEVVPHLVKASFKFANDLDILRTFFRNNVKTRFFPHFQISPADHTLERLKIWIAPRSSLHYDLRCFRAREVQVVLFIYLEKATVEFKRHRTLFCFGRGLSLFAGGFTF